MSASNPKDSSRLKGVSRERKAQLRVDAEARQAYREARSPEQQLALLNQRRGKSARERARLLAQG